MGILVSIAAFTVGSWALYIRFFTEIAVPGWTSTVTPLASLQGSSCYLWGFSENILERFI